MQGAKLLKLLSLDRGRDLYSFHVRAFMWSHRRRSMFLVVITGGAKLAPHLGTPRMFFNHANADLRRTGLWKKPSASGKTSSSIMFSARVKPSSHTFLSHLPRHS